MGLIGWLKNRSEVKKQMKGQAKLVKVVKNIGEDFGVYSAEVGVKIGGTIDNPEGYVVQNATSQQIPSTIGVVRFTRDSRVTLQERGAVSFRSGLIKQYAMDTNLKTNPDGLTYEQQRQTEKSQTKKDATVQVSRVKRELIQRNNNARALTTNIKSFESALLHEIDSSLALTREISEARRGVLTLATDQLDTSKIAERYSGETLHNYSSQVDVTVSTLMLYDLALTGAFSGFTPDDVADLVWLGYRSDKDSKKLFVSEERQTELLEKVRAAREKITRIENKEIVSDTQMQQFFDSIIGVSTLKNGKIVPRKPGDSAQGNVDYLGVIVRAVNSPNVQAILSSGLGNSTQAVTYVENQTVAEQAAEAEIANILRTRDEELDAIDKKYNSLIDVAEANGQYNQQEVDKIMKSMASSIERFGQRIVGKKINKCDAKSFDIAIKETMHSVYYGVIGEINETYFNNGFIKTLEDSYAYTADGIVTKRVKLPKFKYDQTFEQFWKNHQEEVDQLIEINLDIARKQDNLEPKRITAATRVRAFYDKLGVALEDGISDDKLIEQFNSDLQNGTYADQIAVSNENGVSPIGTLAQLAQTRVQAYQNSCLEIENLEIQHKTLLTAVKTMVECSVVKNVPTSIKFELVVQNDKALQADIKKIDEESKGALAEFANRRQEALKIREAKMDAANPYQVSINEQNAEVKKQREIIKNAKSENETKQKRISEIDKLIEDPTRKAVLDSYVELMASLGEKVDLTKFDKKNSKLTAEQLKQKVIDEYKVAGLQRSQSRTLGRGKSQRNQLADSKQDYIDEATAIIEEHIAVKVDSKLVEDRSKLTSEITANRNKIAEATTKIEALKAEPVEVEERQDREIKTYKFNSETNEYEEVIEIQQLTEAEQIVEQKYQDTLREIDEEERGFVAGIEIKKNNARLERKAELADIRAQSINDRFGLVGDINKRLTEEKINLQKSVESGDLDKTIAEKYITEINTAIMANENARADIMEQANLAGLIPRYKKEIVDGREVENKDIIVGFDAPTAEDYANQERIEEEQRLEQERNAMESEKSIAEVQPIKLTEEQSLYDYILYQQGLIKNMDSNNAALVIDQELEVNETISQEERNALLDIRNQLKNVSDTKDISEEIKIAQIICVDRENAARRQLLQNGVTAEQYANGMDESFIRNTSEDTNITEHQRIENRKLQQKQFERFVEEEQQREQNNTDTNQQEQQAEQTQVQNAIDEVNATDIKIPAITKVGGAEALKQLDKELGKLRTSILQKELQERIAAQVSTINNQQNTSTGTQVDFEEEPELVEETTIVEPSAEQVELARRGITTAMASEIGSRDRTELKRVALEDLIVDLSEKEISQIPELETLKNSNKVKIASMLKYLKDNYGLDINQQLKVVKHQLDNVGLGKDPGAEALYQRQETVNVTEDELTIVSGAETAKPDDKGKKKAATLRNTILAIYGRNLFDRETLEKMANELAANMEPETSLEDAVELAKGREFEGVGKISDAVAKKVAKVLTKTQEQSNVAGEGGQKPNGAMGNKK